MTVKEAAQMVMDINRCPGWMAWPAKSSNGRVPLVWFTRIDGSTRTAHAYHLTDFHRFRIKIEGDK